MEWKTSCLQSQYKAWQIKIQSYDDCFFQFQSDCLCDWVPEGWTVNLVILITIRKQLRRRWQNYGKIVHGFFAMTTYWHMIEHSTTIALSSSVFSSKISICVERNITGVHRSSKNKNNTGHKQIARRRCETLSNHWRFTWSGLWIRDGSTLGVIHFILCNVSNKNNYSICCLFNSQICCNIIEKCGITCNFMIHL